MSIKIILPDQIDLSCNVCSKRSVETLIHKIEMNKANNSIILQLCDECICNLKEVIKDY